MRSIEITFRADATTKIEAHGFKGNTCQTATEPFEKALGAVTDDRKKPEFYQKADISLKQAT